MDNRKEYIGGSDIAAVMGLSRWKTPLQLWAEKTGRVEPEDISQKEAVQLGIELEDFVAQKFERVTGMNVRRAPQNYIHPKYSFMRCQVDRLVTGTIFLLECKTCSAWKAKEWEGEEIPQEYILQVMYQLMITGREIGYIAVLIGGQQFLYKEIKADKELFDKMEAAAIKFWQMVEQNQPPMAMAGDDDVLLALHPTANEQIQLVEEMNNAIAQRQELSMHIGRMEEEKELLEVKLKDIIGDNLGIKTSEYIVKWTPTSQRKVDTDKLKSSGLYDQYSKKIEFRKLSVNKNKGEQNVKR